MVIPGYIVCLRPDWASSKKKNWEEKLKLDSVYGFPAV